MTLLTLWASFSFSNHLKARNQDNKNIPHTWRPFKVFRLANSKPSLPAYLCLDRSSHENHIKAPRHIFFLLPRILTHPDTSPCGHISAWIQVPVLFPVQASC